VVLPYKAINNTNKICQALHTKCYFQTSFENNTISIGINNPNLILIPLSHPTYSIGTNSATKCSQTFKTTLYVFIIVTLPLHVHATSSAFSQPPTFSKLSINIKLKKRERENTAGYYTLSILVRQI
jgi:hypothetical protein